MEKNFMKNNMDPNECWLDEQTDERFIETLGDLKH